MNGIHIATRKYEEWLGEQIVLIPRDLKRKHKEMEGGAFPFLRSTFYRWAQKFPVVCKQLMNAPAVLGVGDLHVENFGTWRDIEGRLVWGVNDFDEACNLPYASDLVRLAVSAQLAVPEQNWDLSAERASKEILDGYQDGLTAGGHPFVLAERHSALREMARERLKLPEKFWDKFKNLPALQEKTPAGAMKALRRQLPADKLKLRVIHRVSGLGSLGRRRYTAIANWRGAIIAREAKELCVSAWHWANPEEAVTPKVRYEQLLERAVRCPDPFAHVRGRWIVRRLSPDCSRIELKSVPSQKHAAVLLLRAMGWETANIHLGSRRAAEEIQQDLDARTGDWLGEAARAMAASTVSDWKAWRKGP